MFRIRVLVLVVVPLLALVPIFFREPLMGGNPYGGMEIPQTFKTFKIY